MEIGKPIKIDEAIENLESLKAAFIEAHRKEWEAYLRSEREILKKLEPMLKEPERTEEP